MKVIRINTYLDGGTKEIVTNENTTFWIDGRINSPTNGQFFKRGYPGTEKSELMDDDIYEDMLVVAIQAFENKAINDYSTKLDARSAARKLIVRFFDHGKLNIFQAKLAAHHHIDLLLESELIESEREKNYIKSVKFELDNRMVMWSENPEIDNVN